MVPDFIIEFVRRMQDVSLALDQTFGPRLEQAAQAIQQLASASDVRGYTNLLADSKERKPGAWIIPRLILHCGAQAHEERCAGQAAASQLLRLAKTKTRLTTRRRVKALIETLKPWGGLSMLRAGCEEAGVPFELFEQWIRADQDEALQHLRRAASLLVEHLPDPRGRPPTRIGETHGFLLLHYNDGPTPRAFSYNEIESDCTDPATQATRLAFNKPRFDPRPIHRYLTRQGLLPNRSRATVQP